MIEAQAKVGGMVLSYKSDKEEGETPASTRTTADTPAPSTSTLTGPDVLITVNTLSGHTTTSTNTSAITTEVSGPKAPQIPNPVSVAHEEHSTKRARIDLNPVNLSGQAHNFVVPDAGQLRESSVGILQVNPPRQPSLQSTLAITPVVNPELEVQLPERHSAAIGGLSHRLPQQTHGVCVSPHPGPASQKPVQA